MKFDLPKTAWWVLSAAVLISASVPFWLKVDYLPIRLWDEARNAVNAVEMLQSGDLLVRSFDFKPETYNLKPPFLTWTQLLCFKLFGINELSVRFPSILSGILSLVVVFWVTYKTTRSHLAAMLGLLVLATSAGFYGEHVGRYGDHDAMVSFFMLAMVVSVFEWSKNRSGGWLGLAGLFLLFGVLTKSIAPFMFMPGLLVALSVQGKLKLLVKSKALYITALCTGLGIACYYILRSKAQPDYLYLVWNDELFPRYVNKSSNLQYGYEGFGYYFKLLLQHQYRHWFILTAVMLVGSLVVKTSRKHAGHFYMIIALVFLLIISLGTQNFWYSAPVFPLLAIALSVYTFQVLRTQKTWLIWIGCLAVAGISTKAYLKTYHTVLATAEPSYNNEAYGIGHFLQKGMEYPLSTQILLDSVYGFEPHLFYVRRERMAHNNPELLKRTFTSNLQPGDTLLISHQENMHYLRQHFQLEGLDSLPGYAWLVALGPKDN